MRSINYRTWNTRFAWKSFLEKSTKLVFIIFCRHQPTIINICRQERTITNICRHQSPLVQILVATNLLLEILVDTHLLETPFPTARHQLSKSHQSLCLRDTNLLLHRHQSPPLNTKLTRYTNLFVSCTNPHRVCLLLLSSLGLLAASPFTRSTHCFCLYKICSLLLPLPGLNKI
jgi:hypothetical protein